MGCLSGAGPSAFSGVNAKGLAKRVAKGLRALAAETSTLLAGCFKVSPVVEGDDVREPKRTTRVEVASEPDAVADLLERMIEEDAARTGSATGAATAPASRNEDYDAEEMRHLIKQQQQQEATNQQQDTAHTTERTISLVFGANDQAPRLMKAEEAATSDAATVVTVVGGMGAKAKAQAALAAHLPMSSPRSRSSSRAQSPAHKSPRLPTPRARAAPPQQQQPARAPQRPAPRMKPFDPATTAAFFAAPEDGPGASLASFTLEDCELGDGDDAAEWDQFEGDGGAIDEQTFAATYSCAISPRTRALHEAQSQAIADSILRDAAVCS